MSFIFLSKQNINVNNSRGWLASRVVEKIFYAFIKVFNYCWEFGQNRTI